MAIYYFSHNTFLVAALIFSSVEGVAASSLIPLPQICAIGVAH